MASITVDIDASEKITLDPPQEFGEDDDDDEEEDPTEICHKLDLLVPQGSSQLLLVGCG